MLEMNEQANDGVEADGNKHAGDTDGELYISLEKESTAIRGGSAAAASWENIPGKF